MTMSSSLLPMTIYNNYAEENNNTIEQNVDMISMVDSVPFSTTQMLRFLVTNSYCRGPTPRGPEEHCRPNHRH